MDFNFAEIALQYVCLLFSLSIHEASHAAMANRCGDPTARLLGRMTLNPVKHADPFGTVLFPLIILATGLPFLFGWAKPVPFNQRNLNNIRRDPVWIALAGPLSNFAMALVVMFTLRIAVVAAGPEILSNPLTTIAMFMIMINLFLGLFNCIPVPPLDGHYLLDYFLPPAGQQVLERIGPFGIIIAIVVANVVLPIPFIFLYQAISTFIATGMPF